jgi:hypothetical protein
VAVLETPDHAGRVTRHDGAADGFAGPTAAPHRFPGSHGEVADRLAEVAALLADATVSGSLGAEAEALCRKRFHVSAALARHDPQAASLALARLAEDLRRGAPGPGKGR